MDVDFETETRTSWYTGIQQSKRHVSGMTSKGVSVHVKSINGFTIPVLITFSSKEIAQQIKFEFPL